MNKLCNSKRNLNWKKRNKNKLKDKFNIKKKYKEKLVSRMFTIFQNKVYNDTIKAIKKHGN